MWAYNKTMSIKKLHHFGKLLFVLSLFSGFFFSSIVSADDSVIDDVNVAVPASCSLSGTGMTSHNAAINNGTYNSAIGETTMTAFCNDNEGFAIYAIGYTDDTDGKNVLTSNSLGSTYDIATGTATSGSNSNWAMKLSTITSPTPTYPITIENSFNNFHNVPNDYTLVAKRTSATDIGQNAEGSTLKSTYQTYISKTQAAGTYIGQVKYVLVHPNNTEETPVKSDQIAVIYGSNGLSFQDGTSTNRVVYSGTNCSPVYLGTTPTIVKTPNISNDGSLINAYNGESAYDIVSFNGADRIQVVIDFGLRYNNEIILTSGEWDGEWDTLSDDHETIYGYQGGGIEFYNGTKTFIIEDDTASIQITGNDGGYYGMYARFYPVYDTKQNNTMEKLSCDINSTPSSGSYAEPTGWNTWYMMKNGKPALITNEESLLDYLEENQTFLFGTTVYVYAYNPYGIVYNGNGSTAGSMNGYYTPLDFTTDEVLLTAPNFYKTNYGFVGWSEDQNATINNGAKIYGPNETVVGTDLHFDNSTHGATLYAVWTPSAGILQNWNGCSSLGRGRVTALTDNRDGQTYAIAKLADGNCWMIENLRLDAANSGDSTKAQGFGGNFTGLANSESANFTNSTTANSKYSTTNITGSNQGFRFPRYNNANTSSPATNMSTTDTNIYSYGNYYTWAAAMANTTNIQSSSISESIGTSICPSGWQLPYGNNEGNGANRGGFYYLLYKLNNDSWSIDDWSFAPTLETFPNNFLLSGSYNNSTFYRRGLEGGYWTSTNSDRTGSTLGPNSAYPIYIYSHSMAYYNPTSKFLGNSVRCLTFGN